MDTIVDLSNVCKSFGKQEIFHKLNLKIERGEFVVMIGKSGSGKSTLLNMIGLLLKADSGSITLFGETNIAPYSRKAEKLLRTKIGYLFQNFALIDEESVYDNLKLVIKGKNKQEQMDQVLRDVGLSGYGSKKIYTCSGGEQQRIALARLLLKPCDLILADEPTGSLDHENKLIVWQLLEKMHMAGKTIIVVTHDEELKQFADRIISLDDLSD